MKIVIQRVSRASVTVRGEKKASIENGLLLLVGVSRSDTERTVQQSVAKILKMRIFEDEAGKMNRSVQDVDGEILLVPNFTLCADTEKGNRPGFGGAAEPEKARALFNKTEVYFRDKIAIQTGIFGVHMEVELLNDGPVTFILEKA